MMLQYSVLCVLVYGEIAKLSISSGQIDFSPPPPLPPLSIQPFPYGQLHRQTLHTAQREREEITDV